MMKNLKKVLALVLVFAMSLSVVAFAGAVYPDVDDAATYAEAVRILKSLGIMQGDEQGNFNPDKTVTRAEMATILCNLTGVGEQAPVDTGFADTTKAHWASGYVAYAKNAGWINGIDANTFAPDAVIKWEQAVKLIMATAGWGIYADENGGYPTGWVMAGAEAEITRAGAAGGIGEDCTRAKVAMLLYYALEANTMKQTAFGDKKWEIMKHETIISKYLGVYKVEGRITNSFKHNDNMDYGRVNYLITRTLEVSGEDLVDRLSAAAQTRRVWNAQANNGAGAWENVATGNYILNNVPSVEEAADLLAYTTVAYVQVDDYDDVSIVAIASKGARNKTVVIEDMELLWNRPEDFDNQRNARNTDLATAGDFRFCFWNDRDADNNISSTKVDDAAIFVVNSVNYLTTTDITNGVQNLNTPADVTDYILDQLTKVNGVWPADTFDNNGVLLEKNVVNGVVEMTDTDNDNDIDLFVVTQYGTAVVDSVNVNKQKIVLKDRDGAVASGSLELDPEQSADLKTVSLTLDGAAIELADLAENDVLTISCNNYANPRYYDIKVSRATVEGKVAGIAADNQSVFVNGEEYDLSPLVTANLHFRMSDEVIFYLDATGKIAAVEKVAATSSNYAAVDRFVMDQMGTVSMRLLNLEGAKVTANVADKVKLNGKKVVLADPINDNNGATYRNFLADMGLAAQVPADYNMSNTWYQFISDIINASYVSVNAQPDAQGNYPTTAWILNGTANADLNKVITFDTADDEIDEIAFPIRSSNADTFGYVTNAVNAEWQAKNYRFQGSRTLSDSTVVFNLAGTIDDWKVAKAENLVDENLYSPYFYAMQNDGTVGLAVLFNVNTNINQDASLAYFVSARRGVYEVSANNEEDVIFITYFADGELVAEALPVDTTTPGVAGLTPGTAFTYAKDDKGIVDQIVPVFVPSAVVAAGQTVGGAIQNANLAIDIGQNGQHVLDPNSILDDFMTYDGALKCDNEVYVGVLIKAAGGKLTVADTINNGVIAFDDFENINVPETASVIQYKSYASDSKKLSACDTIVDLESSSIVKVPNTQNIDVAQSDLTFVFFRMNNGAITEVLGIDLFR